MLEQIINYNHRGFDMVLRLDHVKTVRWDKSTYDYDVMTPTGVRFVGNEFCPGYSVRGKEEILDGLLFWLTLKPGDTDKEYFKDYTPEQLAWAQSWECEVAASELPENL